MKREEIEEIIEVENVTLCPIVFENKNRKNKDLIVQLAFPARCPYYSLKITGCAFESKTEIYRRRMGDLEIVVCGMWNISKIGNEVKAVFKLLNNSKTPIFIKERTIFLS